MSEDAEYIKNYAPGRLYVNPAAQSGAYVTIAEEGETVIDEFDVGPRFKLAVTAFFVSDKNDFNTFKLHKLQFRKHDGWFLVESISFNGFHLEQIRRLTTLISSLDLSEPTKTRVDLGSISLDNLLEFFGTESSTDLVKKLSESSKLNTDIFAIAHKRSSLSEFKTRLREPTTETDWQNFFEKNPWIFGFGLNYVFLDRAGRKFEAVTSGADFQNSGKRADGLAMSRAYINQFVLIEIKKNSTPLIQPNSYRPGVWGVSSEVSNAVSQSQKTVHEFCRKFSKVQLKDSQGDDLPEVAFAVQPKSYLVVGTLDELVGNDDKITCFELYRRSIHTPEILTFDELFHRATNLVSELARDVSNKEVTDEEIPF